MPARSSRESRQLARARAPWHTIRDSCRIERALRRGAPAILLALITFEASAQLSATASILSDYRYRGISLSHGDPAAQFGLAWDDPSGVYAGLFASSVQFAISPHRQLQLVPYAGYVRRLASGWSAEVGAEYATFTGAGNYDYAEVYVGIAGEQLSARLYYAPRYFGREPGAFYAEINGAQALNDRIRVLAHVGMLVNLGEYPLYGPSDRRLLDGRLGVAVDIEPLTLQASWVGIDSTRAGYPVAQGRKNTAVVTLSWTF
jgi:uncharacterized protein (TIGR02001 family)